MEVGDKIKFKFGKGQKQREGTVVKVFPKTVYLKADFPNQKGKVIRRKRHQVS